MECAPPLQLSLQTVMADKEQLWISMQEKFGLAKHGYQEVSSWAFGDAVFGWDYDFFGSGTKARKLGFHEFVDTEQMFFELFDELKANKVIPS
jgi:hypothetical protein